MVKRYIAQHPVDPTYCVWKTGLESDLLRYHPDTLRGFLFILSPDEKGNRGPWKCIQDAGKHVCTDKPGAAGYEEMFSHDERE
jgi:hypothetical protein